MGYLSENLKVLIWQTKQELSAQSFSGYITFVAQQCQIPPDRFRGILRDFFPATPQEETALRKHFEDFGYDLSAIGYTYLFRELIRQSQDELLDKNIRYLLNLIRHGQNADFVAKIDVNPSTLTRWKQGKTKPDRYAQCQIAKYFGFPDAEVLKTSFLFLDLEPVSTEQKKEECKKRIDALPKEEFKAIYYGLKKLLD